MIFEQKNILNQAPINFFVKGKLTFTDNQICADNLTITGQNVFLKQLLFKDDLDFQDELKKVLKIQYNIYVLNLDVRESFVEINYSRLFHSKIDLNHNEFIKILNKISDDMLRKNMLIFGTTGAGKMTAFMASMNL